VVGCVAGDRKQLVHTALLIRSLGWHDEVWAPAGERACATSPLTTSQVGRVAPPLYDESLQQNRRACKDAQKISSSDIFRDVSLYPVKNK